MNRKLVLIGFALLCFSSIGRAQTYPSLKVFGARAFALGDFKEKTIGLGNGFAENGAAFGAKFYLPIVGVLDASLQYSRASYQLDNVALAQELQRRTQGFDFNTSAGKYFNRNVLLGMRFHFGEKIRLFFEPSFGFSWLDSPPIAINGERTDGALISSSQEGGTSRELTAVIGAGLDFLVSKDTYLSIGFNYLKSSHRPEVVVSSIDANGNRSRLLTRDAVDFESINLMLGFLVKFGKLQEE